MQINVLIVRPDATLGYSSSFLTWESAFAAVDRVATDPFYNVTDSSPVYMSDAHKQGASLQEYTVGEIRRANKEWR